MNDDSTAQGHGPAGTAPRKESTPIRVIAAITLVALVVGLFGGWVISALTNDPVDGDVWVIPAQGAQATADSIVLTEPAAAVVGVTLDDGRQAAGAPISTVVQQWDDVFGDTTPRAILVGTSAGGSHSVIVELGEPTATVDSLTFPATPVGGSEIPEFEATQATLVIDGAGVFETAEDMVAALG